MNVTINTDCSYGSSPSQLQQVITMHSVIEEKIVINTSIKYWVVASAKKS